MLDSHNVRFSDTVTRPTIKLNPLKFKKMYNDDGIRLSVIASHFGVSIATIQKNRNYQNLPLRNKRVVYDENEFRRLFHSGINYDTMAEKLNMSRCTVICIRKQMRLPARNQRHKKVRND